MEKFYLLSSTKKVKILEAELAKELKDMKEEIEDADGLFAPGSKSFSSLPVPGDGDYFLNERNIAFRKALKVRKAMQLTLKSDVMKHELKSASMDEYTKENIGLILHQFFTDRAQSLAHCRTMHMLRWARICRDSKTIDALYPEFVNRLDDVIKEQQDAMQRSKRLSLCRDISKLNTSSQYVKKEDLLIYARWLICHLHSVKHIHSYIRVLEWLPLTRESQIQPCVDGKKAGQKKLTKSQDMLRTITRKLSTAGKIYSPIKRTAATFSDAIIPTAPNLSNEKQKPIISSGGVAAIAAACGGGLASDEVNLGMPLNDLDITSYARVLDFLLSCYGIQMRTSNLKNRSDEMDMLHLVLRKFKAVYYDQEQMRHFPTYGLANDIPSEKPKEEVTMKTFKKTCDWEDFIQLKPKIDGMVKKSMTMLKEKNLVDELLRIQSQFFHVSDSQKALSCLREHANCLSDQSRLLPVSVTTNRTGNDTSSLWNKIFDYSARKHNSKQKKEPLGFDIKLSSDDLAGISESDLDLSAAVEILGLEDDDERKHPLANHGTYLAFLALRHLRIRDLQRTCLAILNYLRSIERTLTIGDGGLILNEDGFKLKKQTKQARSSLGIGVHQYMHNTPGDFRADEQEFLQSLELENQDDYFSVLDGRVHVQDPKGNYIVYDVAVQDLIEIEHQLMLVGSHFIAKRHSEEEQKSSSENRLGNNFDATAYSNQDVDRFGVLLDLWTNETAYLENKRKLISCHYELYQHVFDPKEKCAIAQIITDIANERPRFDFSGSYFVQTYRHECCILRLRLNIIESIANKQVELQREYLQKVNREQESTFGMPLGIIPIQNVSLVESRPALKHVYLIEFHPSLALVSKVSEALSSVKQEFERIYKPKEPNQIIALERRFYEVALDEYQKLKPIGQDFSFQIKRDLFSDTFIEDPLFVCTFGQSSMLNLADTKRSAKGEKDASILFWCKLLQIISLRHRLIESCDESSLLSLVYKQKAKELGFDECHLYMRAVSFEFAQRKPEAETKPISTAQFIQNDSVLDRYTPNNIPLAVQELDEKHIGGFSLRTKEGLLQLCQDLNVENLRTTLMCQVVHKNLLVASLFQMNSCLIFERKIGMSNPMRAMDLPVMSGEQNRADDPFKSAKSMDAWRRKLQESFVSMQVEKLFLRNRMLNKFLDEKAAKGIAMNNVEEVIKSKRKIVEIFCDQLFERSALHILRSQIISCIFDLQDLLSEFPKTRDSHFIFGKEEEASKNDEAEIKEDPTQFSRRSSFMISSDGKHLVNLWYLPHYREVLQMFSNLSDEHQKEALTVMLRICATLLDICQYLCAHAKLGSSQARLGSKKLQFSGVTADWGGTEGIGAELREIQQQVNKLTSPKDPFLVAKFLEKKRDVMYFEFDITVSRSVRNTFLSSGNENAFKSITDCMHSSLRELSGLTRPSAYSSGADLPDPLFPEDKESFDLCPWRTFLSRYGIFPLMNRHTFRITSNMLQCLAGLGTIDRHVVNGEILSLSLLLEDVLAHGQEYITSLLNTDSVEVVEESRTSKSRISSANQTTPVPETNVQQQKLSLKETPFEAVQFLFEFLHLYSTLEQVKDDWARRKLGLPAIKTPKQFHAFVTLYRSNVLKIVYKQIAAKQGKENEYDYHYAIDDNEPLATPSEVGDYAIKARQLIRLLESLACSMINDTIRRISREHTLVIAERSRDDPNLPTDLWKKSSMKANIVVSRPHVVEDFYDQLMSDHIVNGDTIIFSKDHMEKCFVKFASDAMQRERKTFDSYAGFYEGILRQQHQAIYLKEQELKQAKRDSRKASLDQGVEMDCLMADKCRDIILEVTALRSKVSEMADNLANQERNMREQFKQEYNSVVIELFNNAFRMKNRFEQFRSGLYDDVSDCLGDVRLLAVQSMKKLRERSGQTDVEADSISQRLIRAEQLREAQWESKNLLNMILKLKALSHWNKTKSSSKFNVHIGKLQQQFSRSQREALEAGLVQEEKETLLKQEIASLRRALNKSEKDCQVLRKKLSKEHKIKVQKSNTEIQEAFSQRKIDLARTANIEKLLHELEEKDEKLRALSELTDRDNSVSRRSKVESKRALRQVLQQLSHERHLKLDAFERCDDLQKLVGEYEEQLEIVTRPTSSQSYHASCFPTVPGGATSPQRALVSARPHTQASMRSPQRSKSSRSLQQSQWRGPSTTPNGGAEGGKVRLKSEKTLKAFESEKANARLKKKISETLLADYDVIDDSDRF